jgi:23S rRNA U2552 (ribose-2'-O)-methylase RlmE/FtsJ
MARYQRKDAYHQRAKREGFRSRAAYKLEEVQRRHKLLRRGQKVLDLGCVVLSDAAPKITGVRDTDRANEERLLEAIEALLPTLLRPGGDLLLKIMEGPEAQQIDKRLRRHFERAKTVKPEASRKGTTERYLLARHFQPV